MQSSHSLSLFQANCFVRLTLLSNIVWKKYICARTLVQQLPDRFLPGSDTYTLIRRCNIDSTKRNVEKTETDSSFDVTGRTIVYGTPQSRTIMIDWQLWLAWCVSRIHDKNCADWWALRASGGYSIFVIVPAPLKWEKNKAERTSWAFNWKSAIGVTLLPSYGTWCLAHCGYLAVTFRSQMSNLAPVWGCAVRENLLIWRTQLQLGNRALAVAGPSECKSLQTMLERLTESPHISAASRPICSRFSIYLWYLL